jgi:hypothetical protein
MLYLLLSKKSSLKVRIIIMSEISFSVFKALPRRQYYKSSKFDKIYNRIAFKEISRKSSL